MSSPVRSRTPSRPVLLLGAVAAVALLAAAAPWNGFGVGSSPPVATLAPLESPATSASPPPLPSGSATLPTTVVASPSDMPVSRQRPAGATFSHAAPPPSTTISGTTDLLSTGGALLAATDRGIARSTSVGQAWQYVLRGIDVWSLARAGSGFAAVGRRAAPYENGPTVIATSEDGVRWRVIAAADPSPSAALSWSRLGATGVGVNAVDVAVPDIAATGGHGESLRSIDGGRTWAKLARPFSTGIQAMPDGVTMYATSDTGKAGCWGAVYRSNDAGAHWGLLKSSCVNRALYAVTFVDEDHGFAAGGTPTKFGGSEIVEATDDGGRTWKVRWSTPFDAETYGGGGNADGEIIRLAFMDARHGFALTGGCTMGANGPCGGRLYATSDAGHHWRATGLPGLAVAASSTGNVYLSGSQRGDSPALAISNDGGHHWAAHSPAAGVFSQPVAGSDGMLWWQTTLGTFTSPDGGKRWSLSSAAALAALPKYAGPLLAAPPHNLLAVDPSGGGLWWSHDDAGTSSDTKLGTVNDTVVAALGPGGRAAALVGFGDTCVSPEEVTRTQVTKPGWLPETRKPILYVSSDGGTRWHAVGMLAFLASQMPGSFAIDSSLLAVIDACSRLQISTDNGRSWLASSPPNMSVGCVVSVYGIEIWLHCSDRITHSGDKGATWVDYMFTSRQQESLGQPLQAVGPHTALVPAGGSLWRTVDDGAHWVQTWPRLTGES